MYGTSTKVNTQFRMRTKRERATDKSNLCKIIFNITKNRSVSIIMLSFNDSVRTPTYQPNTNTIKHNNNKV